MTTRYFVQEIANRLYRALVLGCDHHRIRPLLLYRILNYYPVCYPAAACARARFRRVQKPHTTSISAI